MNPAASPAKNQTTAIRHHDQGRSFGSIVNNVSYSANVEYSRYEHQIKQFFPTVTKRPAWVLNRMVLVSCIGSGAGGLVVIRAGYWSCRYRTARFR